MAGPSPDGRELIIAGFGDSGQRLAHHWRERGGGTVTGLCRDPARLAPTGDHGIVPMRCDLDAPAGEPPAFRNDALLVWLAPPPRSGQRDTRIETGLPWLTGGQAPARIVYVSTTGVYGGATGRIDESVVPEPDTDRGRRRLAAEETVREHGRAIGSDVVRLRVAGIYGPGRWPLRRLESGRLLDPELARRPGNRIHVSDLVQALYLAALRGPADAVYNVSDDSPAPFGDYLDACADRFGLPRPTRGTDGQTDPARDFLRAERQVDARRIQAELGLRLQYPDYRQGVSDSPE